MEPSHDRPPSLTSSSLQTFGTEPLLSSSSDPFWSQVCTLLRTRIGREFDRWFRNLTACATDDGVVLITVPNPINQLWIESNYATTLSEAVTEVLGGPRSIQFTVDAATAERLPADTAEPELALSFRQMGAPAASREPRGISEPAATPEVVVRSPENLADAGLSAKFSFENFVVGTTNSYCAAVAKAVAEKPGRIYNPLFFHSAPGLGKTHLLQAIGREIMFRKKRAVVRYVTSESFTNEFIDAIRKQTLPQFRAKYRKVDVLLIDDVQFFAGKDSTQEEFFHTFNELFNNTKQIVLASDRAPGDIKDLEARLVSRFEWGLTTQIQMPDYETRMAILTRKLLDLGGQMEPWILEFIAQRVRTDVRKLEGSLMRVAAHLSIAEGMQPTEVVIENLLRDVLDQEPGKSVNIDRIQRIVAERYDIRLSEMNGRGRPKMIAEARQVAMYLTREMAKLSLVEVGKAFGGRDHGTVIHACKVVNARMDQGEDFRVMIAELKAKISAP
ncbi:MAG: chromosomal replication initiator protein [Verrucomicrobiaceae bacterium]|nr:chromosomal replication initiator protein [Verrucomicrobiaceae bacterium]